MLALSQMSRESTKRKDPRPILSDLRGSGSLEQDSDIVLAIHRPGYYSGNAEEANVAEVHILKSRNGPTGQVNLTWNGLTTEFTD